MAQYGMTCPTPKAQCRGSVLMFGNGRERATWHQTAKEVLRCYGKYLESQGYERVSSREYKWPGGGKPRLILSKNPGAPVISGKNREKKGLGGRPMGAPHAVKSH